MRCEALDVRPIIIEFEAFNYFNEYGDFMKLAADIAPHLPFLRRFSRALTGGQSSGDSYVVALLEALIADPAQFDPEPNVRVAIYRNFCKLWESISVNVRKSNTVETNTIPFTDMP